MVIDAPIKPNVCSLHPERNPSTIFGREAKDEDLLVRSSKHVYIYNFAQKVSYVYPKERYLQNLAFSFRKMFVYIYITNLIMSPERYVGFVRRIPDLMVHPLLKGRSDTRSHFDMH